MSPPARHRGRQAWPRRAGPGREDCIPSREAHPGATPLTLRRQEGDEGRVAPPRLLVALLLGGVCVPAPAAAQLLPSEVERTVVTSAAGALARGGGGPDLLLGGPGPDRLFGDEGPDVLDGAGGDDALDGGSGGDELVGGPGNDQAAGGFGHDVLLGDDGDDVLDGGEAPDRVVGGVGDDTLHGGTAGDVIDGGPGNDALFSDSGPDTILGGEGDDTVFANTGTAVAAVDCGPDTDTIYINPRRARGGVSNRQALREGRIAGCETILEAAAPVDPAKGLKLISTSDAGVVLGGSELDDTLLGGPGPDAVHGFEGRDVLWGNHLPTGPSFGTDELDAGAGDDIVYGSRAANRIFGGEGDDFLQGGPGRNTIDAGDGDDRVRLRGRGPNRVSAGHGDDVVEARVRGAATIDCGPGRDRVAIGFNRRVRTVRCETVTHLYR